MSEVEIGKIFFGKMLTLLSNALEGPCAKIGLYVGTNGVIELYAYTEDGNHIQNKTVLSFNEEQMPYAVTWIKNNCKVAASTLAYYYIQKEEETTE